MLAARGGPLPVGKTVGLLLAALPIKDDIEEAEAAYGGLCSALESKDPQVLPHAVGILRAFATALIFDVTGGEVTVARMRATVRMLAAEYSVQLEGMVAQLPPDEQNALQQLRTAA
eukprot:1177383-Prorocentrum_minimum.AAC.4